ncbi:SAGA-associated factor 73 [Cryptococcus wingfieldii CBS 7118]|uniref:SAGA-associated factor 73 n=1 Tax=Cryptococcus wingfieldii CBS 7118 TaxID=1295528 RepID=A0A1E3J4N3_9TREE|nr:SAGA-associated factor 73 [Cryptococcus wingfieldii CBS 7118]ODN95797.1 SAGA-associated factor 73 [Cryptococcus wingfieldii CBS 7118]
MPLKLNPRSPLPPFTFSLSPSPHSQSQQQDASPPRPPADFLPEKDMYQFGTYPLVADGEPGRGLVKCERCGKVGVEWAAGEHRRVCSHILDGTPLATRKGGKGIKTDPKKRRASEDTPLSPQKRAKASPILPTVDLNSHDYRGMKKSDIKKLQKDKARQEKKEAKERERLEIAERKRQRANNPINVDRQCGVINDRNVPCARSLTCKTHTVGAKRSVEGRSRPYDELYLDWQREHNPNFKEPARKDRVEKKKEKKKKEFGEEGDDDGLEGDDGRREVGELIALTRMAGDRVKNHITTLGNPSSIQSQPGSATPGLNSSFPPLSALGRSQNNASNRTTAKKPPFQPVWRSNAVGGGDFSDVGRMLVQALAARTKPSVQGAQGVGMPGAGLGESQGLSISAV